MGKDKHFEVDYDTDNDDEDIAMPISTPKDIALLLFLGWLLLMWSALCAQYVSDYNLFFLFSILFYIFNIIVWRIAGCEFLWKVFIRSYTQNKKIGIAAGIMVGVATIGFWTWQLMWMYNDTIKLGRYTTLVPNMTRWWVKGFYFFFLWVFAIVLALLESLFYNVLWDNVCRLNWGFRILAAVWYSIWAFCWFGREMMGANNWSWMAIAVTFVFVAQVATNVVKDKVGLVAVICMRFGLLAAWLLNVHGFYHQWFSYTDVNQFWKYASDNLF